MTCGIYGFKCPDTGAIRYVGASRQIEAAYKSLCAKPWTRLKRGKLLDWFAELRRKAGAPVLVILQETTDSEFNAAKAEWVATLQLVGGADLNSQFITNTHENARSNSRRHGGLCRLCRF
jgi:non-ribosomal peptide synthetase component E (peptide arylation enzyme)